MKKILSFLSVLILTIFCPEIHAQKKGVNDYNLQRAYEVLRDDNDTDKALSLVNEQLSSTPDNIEALLLRARLYRRLREYGDALADINHALSVNKPKKSGTDFSVLHWWKGAIYDEMGRDREAAKEYGEAYRLALKEKSENLQDISFDYAASLYEIKEVDSSDRIYRAMVERDETDVAAMVGIARNMIDRGEFLEATALLDKGAMLSPDYSEVYRFRMQSYKRTGDIVKAIDDGIRYYDKSDSPQTDSIVAVLKLRPAYAEASIKERIKNGDEPMEWKGLLIDYYEASYKWAEAVKIYDEIEKEYGHHTSLNYGRGNAYEELGLYEKAIEDISVCIEEDPDWYYYAVRGDQYRLSGDLQKAIADFTTAIEENPKEVFPYYRRGWCHELGGDLKKALDDYSLGIEIDDTYPYIFLMRGEVYLLEGKIEEANKDFERVLQLDTLVDEGSCRHYALHFLGKDDEAVEWMEKIISQDPDSPGNYYDKACLYSRMGSGEESVAALRTAFEKGFRDFKHIEMDDDMDSVRELPEFKELFSEYEAIHQQYLGQFDLSQSVTEEQEADPLYSEIPMKRHRGGTFEVPCTINGLPLQMIFDTGASDVSISSVEANFMLKNGYLSEKDLKGKTYYRIADGGISEGTIVTIREVKLGDAVLRNVDASVVKNQEAPLLLGQSVLERLGSITIDNQENKLIIKR